MDLDRDRVVRRIRTADRALETFLASEGGQAALEAWEDWVIAWRIAAEQTENYGHRNRLIAEPLKALKDQRAADGDIAYVWASGNQERHNPVGSAARGQAIAINAADPTRPLHIQNLRIVNGRMFIGGGSNIRVNPDAGEVKLKPVTLKDRRTVLQPQRPAFGLARHAHEYLDRLKSLVLPKF